MELCISTRCIPNRLSNLTSFTPQVSRLQRKLSPPLKSNSIALNNPGLRYYNYASIKATTPEDTSIEANQYVKDEPDVVNYSSTEATAPEKTSDEASQYVKEETDDVVPVKEGQSEDTSIEANQYVKDEPDVVNYSSTEATAPEKTSDEASQYVKEETDDVVPVNEGQSEENSGFGGFGLFKDDDAAAADDQSRQFDFLNNLKMELDLEDSFSIALLGVGGFTALWLAANIVGSIDRIPLFPKLMEVVGLGYTIWFSMRYLLFKRNRDELASKIEEIKQQVLGSKN
ncbi:hypothetical protein L1987_34035 [Smallanthus sonchifolius]|uniref:Uncharacterized protein n=1 Tax=Smallanthus sonchifolius TaxID=185202 RepID=A0ACB9HTF0_9ASTR|nr:hypothetical protein L1987_34035 [Smallanthus sonchifolius]